MADVSILLSGYQNEVYELVSKGVPLKWESFVHTYDIHVKKTTFLASGAVDYSSGGRNESKHVQFVREFAASVSLLQTKTSTLAAINLTIQKALKELSSCPYDAKSFQTRL